MMTKNILKYMAAAFVCCILCGAFSSCSDDDPFYSAGPDDYPRILNTDLPEGKGGNPGEIANILRTENFTYDLVVTPALHTTVTWYIDDEKVAEGRSIDVPVLAGTHTVKIVVTTTKGLETSRIATLTVRPLDTDPAPGDDIYDRLVKQGTAATLHGANLSKVVKVIIGTTEVAATYNATDDCVEYTVPELPDAVYALKLVDSDGVVYGCGQIELNADPQYPGIKEVSLWEGSTEINWGASNVLITPEVMGAVAAGSTIRVYYELVDMDEGYHAMRITTNQWGDNPEDQVVPQFDLTEDTPKPFEFTYTADNKNIVDTRGGMLIVGYGYKVTKVAVLMQTAAETTLFEGSTDINWGASNVLITPEDMANVSAGAKIRVYFKLVDMDEGYHAMRITTNQWGDNPEDQVVPQFDLTEDTPNPYEFTYTADNKNIVDTRGGMLIVGYGYQVNKVTYE